MKVSRDCSAGFTLTELVMVIAIASILAAFAVSRINVASFDTEGFANRAAAMVRYAQKIAISQRRTVFVVISGSTLSLCYTDSNCGTPVREPPGTNAFSFGAPSGVSLSGTTFSFSALGKPSSGPVTITVTGDVARTLTVEAETGYVH
ncbi:MAG: prepilin-type N-terminal cleavage/methylation domain-containing protein [Betaproteobacteria bacterium]|nr:prepilin-type N-terminal cleavage/methylation domain-containing protein [Betaproteobacteria bacterium]